MKKLVIILPEKLPDSKHICFESGCPFFQKGQPNKSICNILWSNKPGLANNSLASLCNYYDTRDITIAEVDSEQIDYILSNYINKK